ncbi:MAG: hypothetical protein QM750_29030 [Rubrivivax sp.]
MSNSLFLSDTPIGRLNSGTDLEFKLKPGTYTFQTKAEYKLGGNVPGPTPSLQLSISAGRVYYIKSTTIGLGMTFIGTIGAGRYHHELTEVTEQVWNARQR